MKNTKLKDKLPSINENLSNSPVILPSFLLDDESIINNSTNNNNIKRSISPIHSMLKNIGSNAVDEYDNIVNQSKKRPRKGSLPLPSLFTPPPKEINKLSMIQDDNNLSSPSSIHNNKDEINNNLSNTTDNIIEMNNNNKNSTNLKISPDNYNITNNSNIVKLNKNSISVSNRRNSLELNLYKFKMDSNGRLMLFIVDMKRNINQQRQVLKDINKVLEEECRINNNNTLTEEEIIEDYRERIEEINKNIELYSKLLEMANEFLSISDPQLIQIELYIEKLLKLLSDQGNSKIEGIQREKIINLLIIISKFSRAKQLITSVGSDGTNSSGNSNIISPKLPIILDNESVGITTSPTGQNEILINGQKIAIPDSPLALDKNPIQFQKSHFRSLSFSPKILEQHQQQKSTDLKKKQTLFKLNESPINEHHEEDNDNGSSGTISPRNGSFSPSAPTSPILNRNSLTTRHSPTPIKPPLLSRRVFDLINSNKNLKEIKSESISSNDIIPLPKLLDSSQSSTNHLIETNFLQQKESPNFISLSPLQFTVDTTNEDSLLDSDSDNEEDDKEIITNGTSIDKLNNQQLKLQDLTKHFINEKEKLKKKISFANEEKNQLPITSTFDLDEKSTTPYQSPVFLKDPRLAELKSSIPSDGLPNSKRQQPLVRSKSFGPNKALNLKSAPYKKLARSFSEIPNVKDLENIEKNNSEQEEMAICRICEDQIHSSLLEEHSKICAQANQEDMKAMNVEDHLRAIAKILLTRSSDLPIEKRKTLTELREMALFAIESGTKECLKVINLLNDTIKQLESKDENRDMAIKIQTLITEKINALKRAEDVINSSPRIFRTSSPRILKSPRPFDIDNNNSSNTVPYFGRLRSDSDPTQFHGTPFSSFINSTMNNNNKNNVNNINTSQTNNNVNNNNNNNNINRPKGIPTINDFEFIKPITKGGFGKVFLAKKIRTGDIYAIKRLKKIDMIKKNQIDHVKIERNILAITSNPFVVKMYYSFQSKDYYYLVMEYLQGGDCFSLLQSLGALDEKMATMIIAETVLALEYLHSHGIIHRDLKPDNLLIDKNGHVKLTDFGLSKIGLLEKSTVGVPNNTYYSPNMSAQKSNIVGLPKKDRKLLPLSLTKNLLASSSSSPSIPSLNLQTFKNHGQVENKENIVNYNYNNQQPPSPVLPSLMLMKDDQKPTTLNSPTLTGNNVNHLVPISQYQQQINNIGNRKLSCVGTPDYLAPEILLGIEHGTCVDWFSLGVILYEFLCGVPPFSAPTVQETFQNILKRNIQWPEDIYISPEAKDIIDKLLSLDPKSRLGFNGPQEVKSHPFFKGINWETIRTQEPYFKPKLESLHDTSYFEPRKEFHDLRISQDSSLNSSPFDQNSCFNMGTDSSGISSSTSSNKPFDDFLYVNFQSLLELNQNYLVETNFSKFKRRSSI